MTTDVERQYSRRTLLADILAGLTAAGKNVAALTPDDLAPVDEFHIRGRDSTVELARRVSLSAADLVLDVGCGIGGSARYLAARFGCTVTGVDLTEAYVEVGNTLNQRVGLADRVTLQQADALALPFADAAFDIVWTEHVQMNIADKPAFYSSLVRVLRPGGRLLFHDIFQGPGGGPVFPVPWANDPSISYLVTAADARAVLESLGLRLATWEDRSEASLAWFDQLRARMAQHGTAPLGLHLMMGETAPVKFANMRRNLAEHRLHVVQAVAERPAE